MDGVRFTKPVRATDDIKFLTRDEQRVFLETAKRSRNYNQYVLILETGLRTGEMIGLTWDAIDFEKRTLTVNKTLEFRHGEQYWRCLLYTSYIETGNYLECTFPFMGVRFISINDGYDSDDYKGTTGGLEVVMRSIIYAAYSKDLSVKTTSAKIQMMKQGKYVGGYAPYGYVLHPTIRNKLAVDPEAADVILSLIHIWG